MEPTKFEYPETPRLKKCPASPRSDVFDFIDCLCLGFLLRGESRDSMKPAKSFVIEIKRNGRRQLVRDQEPLWDPKQLKSAIDAVEDAEKPLDSSPS